MPLHTVSLSLSAEIDLIKHQLEALKVLRPKIVAVRAEAATGGEQQEEGAATESPMEESVADVVA